MFAADAYPSIKKWAELFKKLFKAHPGFRQPKEDLLVRLSEFQPSSDAMIDVRKLNLDQRRVVFKGGLWKGMLEIRGQLKFTEAKTKHAADNEKRLVLVDELLDGELPEGWQEELTFVRFILGASPKEEKLAKC